MSKLLQYVNTSIEDTETGEVHDVSLSDLPNLYRQLQIEAEERNDLEAETENDESDSLKFLPEENELEAVAENDESDSLVFLPEEENNESDWKPRKWRPRAWTGSINFVIWKYI